MTEDPKDMLDLPTEFQNKMTPAGFPLHELGIEIVSIMLLRNLDSKEELCKRTRLTVVRTGYGVLGCTIARGFRRVSYAS